MSSVSSLPTDPSQSSPRLKIDVRFHADCADFANSQMAAEVRGGLFQQPRTVHPKYLYDELGSQLFDQICETPEYYPTRTEHALLKRISPSLIAELQPAAIIELGSGACHKTRCLLNAAAQSAPDCLYVPVDVSEEMLRHAAEQLLASYPQLRIHGLVADYTEQLELLPRSEGPRLFVFIGSTIGNFEPGDAVQFLQGIAQQMKPEDRLLLGTDLVKDPAILNAAYNDTWGLTAQFNCNVLQRLNRELGANFSPDGFQHFAQFVAGPDQIEMRLRSLRAQTVNIPSLDLELEIAQGETILTEISRKFTHSSATDLLARANLDLVDWHTPENQYFGLSVSRSKCAPGQSAQK